MQKARGSERGAGKSKDSRSCISFLPLLRFLTTLQRMSIVRWRIVDFVSASCSAGSDAQCNAMDMAPLFFPLPFRSLAAAAFFLSLFITFSDLLFLLMPLFSCLTEHFVKRLSPKRHYAPYNVALLLGRLCAAMCFRSCRRSSERSKCAELSKAKMCVKNDKHAPKTDTFLLLPLAVSVMYPFARLLPSPRSVFLRSPLSLLILSIPIVVIFCCCFCRSFSATFFSVAVQLCRRIWMWNLFYTHWVWSDTVCFSASAQRSMLIFQSTNQ